jgi:hypothetical protein
MTAQANCLERVESFVERREKGARLPSFVRTSRRRPLYRRTQEWPILRSATTRKRILQARNTLDDTLCVFWPFSLIRYQRSFRAN